MDARAAFNNFKLSGETSDYIRNLLLKETLFDEIRRGNLLDHVMGGLLPAMIAEFNLSPGEAEGAMNNVLSDWKFLAEAYKRREERNPEFPGPIDSGHDSNPDSADVTKAKVRDFVFSEMQANGGASFQPGRSGQSYVATTFRISSDQAHNYIVEAMDEWKKSHGGN